MAHHLAIVGDMATTTTSKIMRSWSDRIQSGTFTKAQCNQWSKTVVPLSKNQNAGGQKTNLTTDEARSLVQQMQAAGGVRLTSEHTAQGLSWMSQKKMVREFPEGTIDNFSHFTFQGEALDYGTGGWPFYTPVWRVHLADGSYFDYTAGAWQSGRAPSVSILGRSS